MNKHYPFLLLVIFLFFSSSVFPLEKSDQEEIEALMANQHFAGALEKIRSQISHSKARQEEIQWAKLMVQEAQVEIALHGHETAVKNLKKEDWPKNPLARSMIQIAYAYCLKNYAESYSWEIRKREKIDSAKNQDLKNWTADQIYQESYKAFATVWSERDRLGKYSKNELSPLMSPNTFPHEIRGTLRDSLTYLFVELLEETSGWSATHLNEKYLLDVKNLYSGITKADLTNPLTHPLEKISYLLRDLERWHEKENRPAAALEAHLERIRILYGNFPDKASKEIGLNELTKTIEANKETAWVTMGHALLAEFFSQENRPDSLIKAIKEAKKGVEAFPKSLGADKCRDIIGQIQRPSFSFIGMNIDGQRKRSFLLNYQNLTQVNFKSYAFDIKSYLKNAKDFSLRPRYSDLESLTQGKPIHTWSEKLEVTKDYKNHKHYVTPPSHQSGFYFVIAEDEKKEAALGAQIFFSDLVMVLNKDYLNKNVQVEIVSGKSGNPLKDVKVSLYLTDYQKGHSLVETKLTNLEGVSEFKLNRFGDASYFVVAEKEDQMTASMSPFNLYHYREKEHIKVDTFVYTDRSIYRPGQKIQWKIVSYQGKIKGNNFYLKKGNPTTVLLYDSNHEVIQKVDVKTNKHGSAAGEFLIPEGKLLGQWHIETSAGGSSYIRVEEYKRPTFEVELSENPVKMRLNHEAQIEGTAKYYFGLPVTAGVVKWSIERMTILPWWCFWGNWDWGSGQEAQIIASGKSPLGNDGKFKVHFLPKGDETLAQELEGLKYNYRVIIDVTDEGGETRSSIGSYTIGFSSVSASINLESRFFLAGKVPSIRILRTDLNGVPFPGEGQWSVSKLLQPNETLSPSELPIPIELKKLAEKDYKNADDLKQSRWDTQYSPELTIHEWKEEKKVADGQLKTGEDCPQIPTLLSGAYRLSYKTTDSFGETFETKKDFLVVDDHFELHLPGYFAVEKDSVEVGETIRIFASSGFNNQRMVLKTFQDQKLQATQVLTKKSQLIEIPVEEKLRGGLSFTLGLIHDYQVLKFNESIFVPWRNKELKIEFSTFRDKIRPGTKEKWTLRVLGPDKKNVNEAFEVLAYMYDKSLDTFAPHNPPSPRTIFPNRTGIIFSETELGTGMVNYIKRPTTSPANEFTELVKDTVIFFPHYGVGGPGRRGGFKLKSAPLMLDGSANAALEESALAKSDVTVQEEKKSELRTNFAETAFWRPSLTAGKDGSLQIEFEVPDSLTSWNVWVHAVTNDLKSGMLKAETQTIKELMVRPYLPRFFREGDEVEIKVVINNAASKDFSGTLDFDILDVDTQKSVAKEFNLSKQDLNRPFIVKAKASTDLIYRIKTPPLLGQVAIKAMAKADHLSDGELRALPILPGRFHLMQSKFVTLTDQEKKEIVFDDLMKPQDPTRVNELMVVTLDAQLFYSVLSSVPYIIKYPYQSTEQILNTFVSTGILNSVFSQFPAVKAMAKGFSKRKTPFESWNETDPNRKMALEESPWLGLSKGGEAIDSDLISILDPKKSNKLMQDSLKSLQKSQTSLGGFPWFPGGAPSPLVTLEILYGLSKAVEFGIEVPKPLVMKAWAYMHEHYIQEVAGECMAKNGCSEFITFLNYILSNYPNVSWTGDVFTEMDKKRMLDYSFNHWRNHSPYLKGYLALTLSRFKRVNDAKLVWNSVMDSAITSKDEGTHWAQEDRSWLWYNDTIETHAMALRIGSELGTKESQLKGIVQWLFLNKKLNHWKSTRATSEVIYSLTHYLKKTHQLGAKETVNVSIGKEMHSLEFHPERYTGKKNQIIMAGQKIASSLMPIKIEKTSPGQLFASATWHYSTEQIPSESRGDFMNLERKYFKRTKDLNGFKLLPISEGSEIHVGDEVEVQLSIKSKHQAEYVHLRDPRAAGFEPIDNISRHRWDLGLIWYEEIRDSATNFFFENLPQGEHTLRYRIRASAAGQFKASSATVQPLYAPEFSAFSSGAEIKIGP